MVYFESTEEILSTEMFNRWHFQAFWQSKEQEQDDWSSNCDIRQSYEL